MSLEKFIGTWELSSMVETLNGDIVDMPYGESPLGQITYTNSGFMHAILMKRDRSDVGVSLEELGSVKKPWGFFTGYRYIKAVINYFKASASFVSYSGEYKIKGNEVIHNVSSSFFPDWIGTDLIRTFEFIDDKMILTARNFDGTFLELTWVKKD